MAKDTTLKTVSEAAPTPLKEQEAVHRRGLLARGRALMERLGTTRLLLLLLPVMFFLGLGAGYAVWGKAGSTPAPQQQVRRYSVPVDDDPAIGPKDAPITLIEFSDYECPYCRRWHNEVYLRLMQEYGDKIRFVYRDFPLTSIHPNALPAAIAANCAYEQGAFWQFHDLLFTGGGLGESYYLQYANELGLDLEAFQACLDAEQSLQEVQADFNYAAALGVRSTPTFFLNGLPIVGAQPYEVFKQVIDKELAGEIP